MEFQAESNRHSLAWLCRRTPPSIASRSWLQCRRPVWSKVRPCSGVWLVPGVPPPPHPFQGRLAERGAGQRRGCLSSLSGGLPVGLRNLALTPGYPLYPLKPPWLWADLKKALAEQPEGVRMLAQEFPGSEAASRWSRALERLELHSRPYLQEVQRYETYRWVVP